MSIRFTNEILNKAAEKGIKASEYVKMQNADYLAKEYPDTDKSIVEIAMHEANFSNHNTIYDIVAYSQSTDNNNILFPAFIETALEVIRENNSQDIIYPLIIAGETTIPSDSWKGLYLDLGDAKNQKALQMQGVEEGADIPFVTLKTGEQSLKVHKIAIGIKQTYEATRRAKIDMAQDHLGFVARLSGRKNLINIIDTLINGDGNNNAIPSTMKFTVATAGTLTKTDLIKTSRKFNDASSGLTANIYLCTGGAFDALQEIYTNTNDVNGYAPGKMFTFPQNMLNGASVFYVQDLALGTGNKERIIMLNKESGIRKLIEAGSIIQESSKLIRNQTFEYTVSENCVFEKISAYSAAELLI